MVSIAKPQDRDGRYLTSRAKRLGSFKRLPLIWLALFFGFVLMAILADLIVPFSPTKLLAGERFTPPFWAGGDLRTPLGTDQLGRDMLSRTIAGARTSMMVALACVSLITTVAVVLGSLSGYYSGVLDAILMRIVDGMVAFPGLIVALLFVVLLGPGLLNLILAISVGQWAPSTRILRGVTLELKERDFVFQSKAIGASNVHVIRTHILPNLAPTITVLATLSLGQIILLEAGLTFLGAGLPPQLPSWGTLMSEGRPYIATNWWVPTLPGFAIFLLVLSVNRIGDWMRDQFDPTLRAGGRVGG